MNVPFLLSAAVLVFSRLRLPTAKYNVTSVHICDKKCSKAMSCLQVLKVNTVLLSRTCKSCIGQVGLRFHSAVHLCFPGQP